jgi:hypothetical protein
MRTFIIAITLVAISIHCLAQDTDSKTKPESVQSESKPVKLDEQGEAHPPSIWMQQKLKHSQKIFAGMVEGNLLQVEDSARNLKRINRLESFVRGRSKEYRTQLRIFRYANEEILKGAAEKNLDRVTLGYNQMTLSCVACHKRLRQAE